MGTDDAGLLLVRFAQRVTKQLVRDGAGEKHRQVGGSDVLHTAAQQGVYLRPASVTLAKINISARHTFIAANDHYAHDRTSFHGISVSAG